ncbi:hypothetical protein Phum_PHUM266310 [Pediculus humanus corporis]|uniref:Uncharacterized protein n=1 Tax=Pediculus humanus subsp. corporis TaxID=121224 RepID=E0VKK3_PEDHC|nr:uncharacterized protein Phum_PHUM266310 [Pediculus humanus corporis]EEB13909.1 hypothetical protein Phum_PHUM266310 [Pediculus humanus corporis]
MIEFDNIDFKVRVLCVLRTHPEVDREEEDDVFDEDKMEQTGDVLHEVVIMLSQIKFS